ncbi:ABC transporter permease [Ottowia thiooxydans]|uniref:ABC transporter permease n=1 Tax=Ottowia thiooxydans TaxID=219182 RepID=UPI00041FA230|nr:ABC transporter permease [Ottowia thiooxydans]
MSKAITPIAGFWQRFRKNRMAVVGLVLLAAIVVAALAASWLFPGNPLGMVGPPELWPLEDRRFPLGTDTLGRDLLPLVFHGARTTLLIGLAASAIATLIGAAIGALAGFHGGYVDAILMRITEIFQTVPNLVFLITLVAVFGPRASYMAIGIGLVSWTGIARLTRAEFLSLKNREFVLAARAVGMSDARLILREILPNALPPIIVLASLVVATAVLFEAALAFLGLTDPNIPSWGRLIGDGRSFIRTAWYLCAIPGVLIVITVLSLNLAGDGLNDAFNPRLRTR